MSRVYESLSAAQQEWLAQQHVFFVATAPLAPRGRLNCSPKGGDTFRIITTTEVAYLDLTGSGVETIAHIQENGRILLMFCAFSGAPRIMRLHGLGEALYPDGSEFAALAARFPREHGARAIIRVRLDRISDSCGYAVPLFEFAGHRENLGKWAAGKTKEELAEYRRKKNSASIDGLRGYSPGG